MADTVQLGAPVGTGAVVATDDLGATGQVQWVKLMDGTNNGTATIPGDATNGLRVDVNNVAVADGGTLPAKGVQVGGTDGTVFQVLSTDSAGRLNTNVNGTVPVSGPLTDAQLRATAVPVSGTVTASGPLTDAQLRASSVPVDTELPAAAALADATANPTAPFVGAGALLFNGTTWDRVRGDTTNGVFVNVKTSVLPTGAATAAKQPALGTAGAASADVLSVQGVASMTALKVDPSGVTSPVSAASLPLPSGASTSAKQPALGTAGAASADVITVQGVASMTALKVDGSAVTQPVSLAGTQSVNQAQVAGTATDTNSGVKSAGTQRIVIATDQPALTNALKVDPSAVTSPVSLASLPALATGSNLIGRVNIDPETSNGLSIFHLVSAATTNATNLKASAGQVYGWYIYNSNAAARKVAFHNTAGTPTAGASVSFAVVIPPTSAANVEFTTGIAFATGIAITTVTDLTDAGATAVAASDLIINIFYK